MRPSHHATASGFVKSMSAAGSLKFETKTYGWPVGVFAT